MRCALPSILLLGAGMATAARADYLADRARPVVAASHAEIRAVHLGRHMAQARWNELLDEALWMMAPKGRWSPDPPAREALARMLREASVARLAGETGRMVREVVNEHYSSLEPDDAAKAVAFYESPGGKVFRDFREKVLAETSYGLPYVVETAPRETIRREMEAAKDRLLNLPDEQTQAVYDFNHSSRPCPRPPHGKTRRDRSTCHGWEAASGRGSSRSSRPASCAATTAAGARADVRVAIPTTTSARRSSS